MSTTTLSRSPEEIAEIEKHKYFLSEKAGYDVGWRAAEEDWDSNYAEQYREKNAEFQADDAEGNGSFFGRLLAKARIR